MPITDTIRRQFQEQFGVPLRREDSPPGIEDHCFDPTLGVFGRGHPCLGPEINAEEKDKENQEIIERLTKRVPRACK